MHTGSRAVSLLAFVLLLTAPTPPARAAAPRATFTVTKTADTNDGACDADCSLREAVIAANELPGADTLIVPAGTYTLTLSGAHEDYAATGDLDIRDSVTIAGAGADVTILVGPGSSGGEPDRVFQVFTTTATITGVTIHGGRGDTACPTARRPPSSSSAWQDSGGGGIFNVGALTVTHSTIGSNTACWQGGGIYSEGTLVVLDSTISRNRVDWTGGAGVAGSGTLSVDRSTIAGNSVQSVGGSVGGGGIAFSGTLTVTNSTITGNVAETMAGLGNETAWGAGVYLRGGSAAMSNTTVSSNRVGVTMDWPGSLSTTAAGGGLHVAGVVMLNNVTVAANTASDPLVVTHTLGGGIYTAGTVELRNTLIASNTLPAGGIGPDCAGTLTSLDYNLIESIAGCTLAGATAHTITGRDALLGLLADNGGSTWTHALLLGSPALDRGDTPTCAATDQRGVPRPQGIACDIGAYEGPPAWYQWLPLVPWSPAPRR